MCFEGLDLQLANDFSTEVALGISPVRHSSLAPPRAAGRLTPVICYSTRADSDWGVGDSEMAGAPPPSPTMGKVKKVGPDAEEHLIQIFCWTGAIILAVFEAHNIEQ